MPPPAFLPPAALPAGRPIAPSSRRPGVCACAPSQAASKPVHLTTPAKAAANGSPPANGAAPAAAANGASEAPPPPAKKQAPSRALARAGRVETRPELVGGLPLWAAAGAIAQLARLARSLLSGRDGGARALRSADASDEPRRAASSELRALALRLERETDALRDELAAAKSCAAAWRDAAAVGDARLHALAEAEAAAAASRVPDAADRAARRLLALLMAEQTRAAKAAKGNAVLRARLARAERELQDRERDLVQTGLVAAAAAAVIGVAVSQMASVDGIGDVVRQVVELR